MAAGDNRCRETASEVASLLRVAQDSRNAKEWWVATLRTAPRFAYTAPPPVNQLRARIRTMIQLFTLASSIRRTAPLAWMRQGEVCPGARVFGVYDARGRAP